MSHCSFHLSLNASDLPGMVAFLEQLLGMKPDQVHADYAKFELTDPPLVLSLAPTDAPAASSLNHLGFRLPDHQALANVIDRLTAAGVPFDREENVACCHSRQTKLWIDDPAGNHWELYVLEESSAAASEPIAITPQLVQPTPCRPASSWANRLGEVLPERIPAADGSLDSVVLEGTFNATLVPAQLQGVLQESARTLRADGSLLLRGLTADRPLEHSPRLPGPAAKVEQIPLHADLIAAVKHAGFEGIELTTFGDTYYFSHAGAEIRETRLRAIAPTSTAEPQEFAVTYRGPFVEVLDDSGVVFRRGDKVLVSRSTYHRLKTMTCAEAFILSAPPGTTDSQ